MGFYTEIAKGRPGFYLEGAVPPVFWTLFAIAGFALICMWGAAHSLLFSLADTGNWYDQALVWIFALMVVVYVGFGVKFAWVRKFVHFEGSRIAWGFRFGDRVVYEKQLEREEIAQIVLTNHKPSGNRGEQTHDNASYHYRGHWQIRAVLNSHGYVILDKNSDKEPLEPLYEELRAWCQMKMSKT